MKDSFAVLAGKGDKAIVCLNKERGKTVYTVLPLSYIFY